MVQGDEKVGMLMNSEKKSKKRKKNTATNDSEVTKGDVKAVEHDSCFKEEQLSFTGTRKERDKKKRLTKASGESEDSDIKRKKETGGGKQIGKSSKDGCEDAVRNVLKKKKKLKNEQETLIMHDATLDTKTVAHESASETQETEAVETLRKGSGGNFIDEVKRKKRKKDKRKKEDGPVDIVAGVIQGDVSVDEVKRMKRKKEKKKVDEHVDIVAGFTQVDVSADEVKRKKGKKDKMKKEDGQVDIVAGVVQGDVSAIDEVKRKKRKKDKREKEDGQVDIVAGVIQGNVSVDEVKRKKRKKDKKKKEDEQVDIVAGVTQGDVSADEVKKKKRKKDKMNKEDGQVDIVTGVSQGDVSAIDEMKRKKRKSDKRKKEDGQVDIVAGVTQGDVSADEVKRKKRKKDKMNKEDGQVDIVAGVSQGDVSAIDEVKRKKRKSDKRKKEDGQVDIVAGFIQGNVSVDEVKRKKGKKDKKKKEDEHVDIVAGVIQGDVLAIKEMEDRKIDDVNIRKRKKTKLGHNSKDLTSEKTEKRVRFSDHVQFFPPINDPSDEKHEHKEEKLLFGKQFTQEEDEVVKAAVYRYIEVYNLGDEGLQKVLNCMSNPEVRGCWKEIGQAIPYRPYRSVYFHAQRLFRRGEMRKWTEEEYEMVRKFQRKHGNNWTVLADELGKHQTHVGNAWHRIELENRKRGHWDQEEIQKLFDLVNTDLQLKLAEEKKSRHGMLRDNICWSAISDNLSTRISNHCCNKWYRQLTSPMVAADEWEDTDDYRLIDALFKLDASCIEDVDWDNLLAHRDGHLSRKRCKEMVRQISQHENKSFAAQVEVLARRYRPDLVGAREAWDSKPLVP